VEINRIGIIGLGSMLGAVARRPSRGFDVTAYDPDADKVAALHTAHVRPARLPS